MNGRVAWLAASEGDVPDGDAWLSPGERLTAATLRTPRRRRDWRLGRWTAKRALAASLTGAGPVEIAAEDDGSPRALVGGRLAPVSLSITHRHGVAVCVVADPPCPIGCDLEVMEPREPVFARDWFTAAELALVGAAGAARRDLAVTLVWSAKESALKALREGLRLDTRSVEVDVDLDGEPCQGWRPLAVRHGRLTFGGWWRRLGGQVLTVVADLPAGHGGRPGPPRPAGGASPG